MGNAESSSDEEDAAKKQEQLDQAAEAKAEADAKNRDARKSKVPDDDFTNVENLTYDKLFMDKEEEDDDPLKRYVDEDDEADTLSFDGSNLPSTASNMAQVRPFTASISFFLSYIQSSACLRVTMTGSNDVPAKGQGGASGYQIVLTTLPSGNDNFESKVRIGPNPAFDDEWDIKIVKKQLETARLRFRLYGWSDGERSNLLGEEVLELAPLNLRVATPHRLKLTSKFMPYSMMDHEPESPNVRFSKIDTHNSTVNRLIEQRRTVILQAERNAIETLRVLPSELLLSASYNVITGEFECNIQKAYGLSVPAKPHDLPYGMIGIQLRDGDNKLMAKAKTRVVKKRKHPSFDETFVFTIVAAEIARVTITVTAYHKHPPAKKVPLGSFKIGADCSSGAEVEHWQAIMSANGNRVVRWHKLFISYD